jgi:methyl halide transferase
VSEQNSSDPAFWEARYQVGDHPWAKSEGHPALFEWIESAAGNNFLRESGGSCRVVVPGCGLGEDVRLLAKYFRGVCGLDAAPTAIERAEACARVADECYWVGSIFSPPEQWRGEIDLVVEHTLFCAIDPVDRPRYVEGLRRMLRPGGWFLAIFYCDPQHEPPGPPFGISPEEIDAFFAPDFRLVESWVPGRTFPGREGCEQVRWYQFVPEFVPA